MPANGGHREQVVADLVPGYRSDWDLMGEGVVFLAETLFANQRKPVYFHHFTSGETYPLTDALLWLNFASMGLVVAPDE